MNENARLGKLEELDVHKYWEREAQDFTPWLANPENIALLGDEVGIELEVQETEQNVGPYRADIVCVDTATGDKVLIENQLEKTDHTHLGQILTYAAGVDAVTLIWIADRFTEEHRAALDWLNNITDEAIGFFGFEIQLWRIGDSLPAPRFNCIVRPNEWTKPSPRKRELTSTGKLYLEFWSAFREYALETRTPIRVGKPTEGWMGFPVGRSNFCLTSALSTQKDHMYVQLVIYSERRFAYLRLLEQEKEEIERELGPDLDWRAQPKGKESHIRRLFTSINLEDRAVWPQLHKQLLETLEAFHRVFSPRVKRLDPADWEPEEAPV